MEGETESGSADAAHWSNVYEQLVTVCRSILAEDDASDDFDRNALRRRLRHFEQRRDHWDREAGFAADGTRPA